MKHRITLRTRHVRKLNAYLDNCADSTHSPTLKQMILSRKIIGPGLRQNGHLVQKGRRWTLGTETQ